MVTAAEIAVMDCPYEFFTVQGRRLFPVYGSSGSVSMRLVAFLYKSKDGWAASEEDESRDLGMGGDVRHLKTGITLGIEFSAFETYASAKEKLTEAYKKLETL